MHIDDLVMGMKVRIYDWDYDGESRPDWWNEDGEMDEWLGCVVTIADFDPKSGHVWIEEDEGNWEWRDEDFDPVCPLKADDPNLKFSQKKKDDFMAALRAERKKEQVKKRINPAQYNGAVYGTNSPSDTFWKNPYYGSGKSGK